MITNQEADILSHCSNTGRYVSSEPMALSLAERGYMLDHGAQRFAGGDHYMVMTPIGRSALSEWRAAQPKPKIKKRRRSEEFSGWMRYQDACGRIPFSEYLKFHKTYSSVNTR